MRSIQNVLLDFDGTLLDSNAAHAEAWKEYLAEKTGLNLPVGRVALMIGMGADKIFKRLFGDKYTDHQIEAMGRERDEYYLETQMARVKPIAGAVEFVADLARRGYKVAIASSARREILEPALKLVPVEPHVMGFSTPDEATESKPAPDIFTSAMRKYTFDPNRTAVVGDSPYDAEASEAAGCRLMIGVLSGYFSFNDLATADVIYKNVDELRRCITTSLLA